MSKRMKVIVGFLISAVVVVGGLAWYLGLFSSEPEEASLADATAILAEEGDDTTDGDTPAVAAPITDLTGTWVVEASEATYVGYRIQEVLSSIGDFTAVGRTPAVEGELVGNGLTIESVSITADLLQLASDSGGRDNQLKTQALETNTFPEGTFVLTEPITVDAIPTDGASFLTTATGELTVHGVTKTVQLNIEGLVDNGRIVVIGSADILLTDYDVTPPSAPIVASIEDEAVMEFSLVFSRP